MTFPLTTPELLLIIGVLGVLDDVTVSQAAVVQQLKEVNKELKPAEIYKRVMDVV